VCSYVPYSLPFVDGNIDLFSTIVPIGLCGMLCGQTIRVATMLIHN
jgi:hypothetical protein